MEYGRREIKNPRSTERRRQGGSAAARAAGRDRGLDQAKRETVAAQPFKEEALPGDDVDPGVDWRHSAACLDEDPELFFPTGNTGPALLQIEEAKAVCLTCPVIEQCLKWALNNGEDAGVWGGLSEDERRALKRRNARAQRAW